jgi:hypothetical protein
VPLGLIAAKHGVPEKAMEAAKATGELSGWAVVDTNEGVPRFVDSHRFEVPELD